MIGDKTLILRREVPRPNQVEGAQKGVSLTPALRENTSQAEALVSSYITLEWVVYAFPVKEYH